MLTLGIETSGREASIALRQDGQSIAERALNASGQRHAQTLVAEIDQIFKKYGHAPADCDLIAVSIGPGSFTGLRIGVVCAKTFAYATGARLAAVDTFAAVAENSPAEVDDVWIVADAQRQELYTRRYYRDATTRFVADGSIEIVSSTDWAAARKPGDIINGPGVAKLAPEVSEVCRLLPEASRLPTAAKVAELGELQDGAGSTPDFWKVEPFYLRKSAAEEKRDAEERGAPIAKPL